MNGQILKMAVISSEDIDYTLVALEEGFKAGVAA